MMLQTNKFRILEKQPHNKNEGITKIRAFYPSSSVAALSQHVFWCQRIHKPHRKRIKSIFFLPLSHPQHILNRLEILMITRKYYILHVCKKLSRFIQLMVTPKNLHGKRKLEMIYQCCLCISTLVFLGSPSKY